MASAYVLLEDGARFEGVACAAEGPAVGEIVFTTSMTGYQEAMTDPSYAGQLLIFTYPQVGNYGVRGDAMESDRVHARAAIMRAAVDRRDAPGAGEGWLTWLEQGGVAGINEVDTRALVRHIRTQGAMRGGVFPGGVSEREARAMIESEPPMAGRDLVPAVSSKQHTVLVGAGPRPCFTYSTIRDQLDAKTISWKYYTVASKKAAGIWSAFDAIKVVRDGPEWNTNVTTNPTAIFRDINHGKLPAVSWVTPNAPNSDHPAEYVHVGKKLVPIDDGPSWVASIVNAIGKSAYWDDTAIFITWDDWGGWYDHVKPPQYNSYELGFRVPLIVISAYTPQGYISRKQHEFGSILKFTELVFGLGSLGTTDVRADALSDCFAFSMAPRVFQPISTKLPASHFLNAQPSDEIPDTDY